MGMVGAGLYAPAQPGPPCVRPQPQVLTLVVDLDRPRDGFLQVSQQPLTPFFSSKIGPP